MIAGLVISDHLAISDILVITFIALTVACKYAAALRIVVYILYYVSSVCYAIQNMIKITPFTPFYTLYFYTYHCRLLCYNSPDPWSIMVYIRLMTVYDSMTVVLYHLR